MESLFSVGQKIVCVDSVYNCGFKSPLIEGKTYTVLAIFSCVCGAVDLDVGTRNPSDHLRCSCGHITENNRWLHNEMRFVPLDTNSQLEEEIHQAMKGNLIEN